MPPFMIIGVFYDFISAINKKNHSPTVQRLVQMLLRILDFPLDVDGIVALHVTLNMHLFALDDGDLLTFRRKVGGNLTDEEKKTNDN